MRFSSRGSIYKEVGSKLWSYMGMFQRLLWAEMSHCLRTLSVDQRVLPLLLPQPRRVCAWSHCALGVTWRLAPHQSAYVAAAMVGCRRHENKGMKKPVAAMLKALDLTRAGAAATKGNRMRP